MSKSYLVVDPFLSYFKFAQRISQKTYNTFLQDYAAHPEGIAQTIIMPYSQTLQRTLNAQKSECNKRNFVPQLHLQ